MAKSAHGEPDPPRSPSPYVWEARDFAGKIIRMTVSYNDTTGAITGAGTFRDVDCLFKKILVGLGSDGRPDSTGHAFTAPPGDHAIPVQQLTAQGFSTIEQFQAQQITAGR